ncbi:pullulanase [bacterium]|nr:MAG: pullulanase [bacterium]
MGKLHVVRSCFWLARPIYYSIFKRSKITSNHVFMKAFKYVWLVMLAAVSVVQAQPQFSQEELKTGYALRGDSTWFVFSPGFYRLANVEKVVVTGSFRGWSQDMDDVTFILSNYDTFWAKSFLNKDYDVITPGAEYKFRVNNGDWLDPHGEAPNQKSGNLVFLHNVTPKSLKAEMQATGVVWAEINGMKRSLNPQDYIITNATGDEIKVVSVLPNTSTGTLITPEVKLDKRRVYYLEIPSASLKTVISYDGWFKTLYSDKALGANISDDGKTTVFRLFAPRAVEVNLYLYDDAKIADPKAKHPMKVDENGVWEFIANGNFKGTWYDFSIHGFDEPGNHFYEQIGETVSDPYARVNDDAWGRSMVWSATKPASPLKNGIPKYADVIAYEVHVQDFTDLLPVSDDLKGTIPAMMKSGLKNKNGAKIGFDYLVDLGINTVHLMPIQEFLHYPDEWWRPAFKDDPFMIEAGISEENYQWGYRTTHAFAVETRFRQKGTKPGMEREQFRDLVQAFHNKGIAVIIDIVPNHTGENMDGVNYYFNFNGIDKIYYYRTKNLEHIGEYGNEVKTENRPMVQRWLIDQCLAYINEFGIDGFRIDLAGQVDEQTLIALKKAIGEDKILYGEPWIGSNDPNYENNPDWDWYKVDSPITFFQDDARNAIKGGAFLDVTNPEPKKERGFSGGNTSVRNLVKLALQNHFPEETSPYSGINYMDIHDNWALADQFAVSDWNGLTGVEENRIKLALTLLMTSQGPLVLHGGSEIMRSKGSAELKETVKEMTNGTKVYLHGKRDTYNMRKANQFVWETVGLKKGQKGATANYKEMFDFWKGMIAFRNSYLGDVFKSETTVPEGYYQFTEPDNQGLLAYIIDEKVLVVMNVNDAKSRIKVENIPSGKWKLIGHNAKVNHEKGIIVVGQKASFKGGQSMSFDLGGTELLIYVKE